jgi:hypothetical protein
MTSSGAEKRRSERVMLRVPVMVMSEMPDGQWLQEATHTAVVNAHGGLLKLAMEVVAGQPILLINATTNVEQSCRVVRVEKPPEGQAAVAFEFDTPAPEFWPVSFPPSDWGLNKQ